MIEKEQTERGFGTTPKGYSETDRTPIYRKRDRVFVKCDRCGQVFPQGGIRYDKLRERREKHAAADHTRRILCEGVVDICHACDRELRNPYYNKEAIIEELRDLQQQKGARPLRKSDIPKSLYDAMCNRFGGVHQAKKAAGIILCRRDPGAALATDGEVLEACRALVTEHNQLPPIQFIRALDATLANRIHEMGGIYAVADLLDCRTARHYQGTDGHRLESLFELAVCELLYGCGVRHVVRARVGRYLADFAVVDSGGQIPLYVEVAGFSRKSRSRANREYYARVKEKQEYYAARGDECLWIYLEDFRGFRDLAGLTEKLQNLVERYGERPISPDLQSHVLRLAKEVPALSPFASSGFEVPTAKERSTRRQEKVPNRYWQDKGNMGKFILPILEECGYLPPQGSAEAARFALRPKHYAAMQAFHGGATEFVNGLGYPVYSQFKVGIRRRDVLEKTVLYRAELPGFWEKDHNVREVFGPACGHLGFLPTERSQEAGRFNLPQRYYKRLRARFGTLDKAAKLLGVPTRQQFMIRQKVACFKGRISVQEKESMCSLYKAGHSAREVARTMSCCVSTVYNVLRQRGVQRRGK